MYIITGKLNGAYEIEGELKEVSKTYKNTFPFYCEYFSVLL